MKTYTTRYGKTQFMPYESELLEMIDQDQGLCLACGEVHEYIEPDAVRYTCEACGCAKVYGGEELALMGLFARDEEPSNQALKASE